MKIVSAPLCLLAALTTFGQQVAAQPGGDGPGGGNNNQDEPTTFATIVEGALTVDDVSTLVDLLDAANLVDTLSGDGPFTVFAPPNSAFEDVDPAVLTCIAGNPDWLSAVLTYHVLPGSFPASAVLALDGVTNVTTVQGDVLTINPDPEDLTLNGDVEITGPDALLADNGVVHLISAVLVPPSVLPEIVACAEGATDAPAADGGDGPVDEEETGPADGDEEETGGGILENIVAAALTVPGVSTLVELVQQAGLADTLSGPGPFTVFAPPNTAFEAVDAKVLGCIAGNPEWLKEVLTYHVLSGSYPASAVAALVEPTNFTTVQGEDVVVDGEALTVNDASITDPDALTPANGVVHLIDKVQIGRAHV